MDQREQKSSQPFQVGLDNNQMEKDIPDLEQQLAEELRIQAQQLERANEQVKQANQQIQQADEKLKFAAKQHLRDSQRFNLVQGQYKILNDHFDRVNVRHQREKKQFEYDNADNQRLRTKLVKVLRENVKFKQIIKKLKLQVHQNTELRDQEELVEQSEDKINISKSVSKKNKNSKMTPLARSGSMKRREFNNFVSPRKIDWCSEFA